MNQPTDLATLARQYAGGLSPSELAQRFEQHTERAVSRGPEPSPEQAEYTRQYWANVFAQRPAVSPDFQCTRVAHIELDFEEARKRVWALFHQRAMQLSGKPGNEFWQFNSEERELIRDMIRYFINDPGGRFDPNKGLFVYGNPGTGKTEIMRIMAHFTTTSGLSKAFRFGSMSEIYTRARSDDNYEPIEPNVQFARCFDEFGRYTGSVMRFGNAIDLNEAIIERRYTRWQNYGQITHMIANCTPNDARELLTSMLFDRLRSMCTSLEFPGESKR